jgi:predicted PurR-regulated permease PerM
MLVDFIRAGREKRYALVINDPAPVSSMDALWAQAGQLSVIGVFLLLAIGFLYLSRGFMLPVVAAIIIGTTFGPLIKFARARGIPPAMTALALVVVLAGAAAIAATLLAGPVGQWIARAPEIGANLRQKLYVLDRPLAAFRELQGVLTPPGDDAIKVAAGQSVVVPLVAFVTPALSEFVLFLVTLTFYLIGQFKMRAYLISLLATREAKLRLLRIFNDIEQNLTGYLTVYTIINTALGTAVALGAWLFGLPNPIILGMLAMILNYVPYIGPAAMAIVLFGVGLVSFPTLGYALLPPLSFVALTTLEGQFLTPWIMGRRLTLNPLMIILALGFWTFLWGPLGAFLAVPLSIVALVTVNHLFPGEDAALPQ